ncbi:hypothetical protein ACFHW2_09395 [Actinomadura sp. LOL_016]|uniref:hypothetical protein n=1 Tax=unclassified Actinomadura TaxID=2626254 RepID=UPI003A800DB0
MDAFGGLFQGVRARGSLFGSSTLPPPWALRFVGGAPLTLCPCGPRTVTGPADGYSDAFAFSAASKRIRGIDPSEFRRTGAVVPERPAVPPPVVRVRS